MGSILSEGVAYTRSTLAMASLDYSKSSSDLGDRVRAAQSGAPVLVPSFHVGHQRVMWALHEETPKISL